MTDNMRAELKEEFMHPEARRDYAEMFLDSSIALQIKSLRLQRGWSQEKLAEEAGLHQSQISKYEQVTHSGWTLETLKKVAKAFDLSLRVSFESFGTLLDEYVKQSRSHLERDSFADDPVFHGQPEARVIDFPMRVRQVMKADSASSGSEAMNA